MNLELLHIATYFPYGLEYTWSSWGKTYTNTIHSIGKIRYKVDEPYGVNDSIELSKIRPLLIPMSRLSEFKTGLHPDDLKEIAEAGATDTLQYIRHDLFIKLVENKFDVFGLIDEGLANDLLLNK